MSPGINPQNDLQQALSANLYELSGLACATQEHLPHTWLQDKNGDDMLPSESLCYSNAKDFGCD